MNNINITAAIASLLVTSIKYSFPISYLMGTSLIMIIPLLIIYSDSLKYYNLR